MTIDRQTLMAQGLQNARRFANAQNVRAPEEWLARADEISELISLRAADSRAKLVARMITYASDEIGALSEIGRIVSGNGDPLERPPVPILQGLASASRFGLAIMGTPATDTLMAFYKAASPSSLDRTILLEALSCIPDPRLNIFFDKLLERDLIETLRTRNRILNRMLLYYPQGDVNPLSEPDENEIVEEAKQTLARLRRQHLEAMSS